MGLKGARKSVQEQSKSVVGVAPEGLEDTRKSVQEPGELKASPVGLKGALKAVQEQSQLVVGVAPKGLKDTRQSEPEQGMLLASPASLKGTLKSEHVADSATRATKGICATRAHRCAHTNASGSPGKFSCHFRDVSGRIILLIPCRF